MKLLDRLYQRSHLTFALLWIVCYVVLDSVTEGISQDLGVSHLLSVPALLVMALALLSWVRHARLEGYFWLCAPRVPASRMLFYLPLVFVVVKKLVLGVALNETALECALWAMSMAFVGLLEELIFRGLLFRAIEEEDGRTRAIIITSITFGIGHIVNLFNASGQSTLETLGQVVFAVTVGFTLVLVMLKGGSLWPCIVFHWTNNAVSVFENEAAWVALMGSRGASMLVSITASLVVLAAYIVWLLRLPDASEA